MSRRSGCDGSVVIQGVVGFFFNAIILALTINVTANLF